MAVLSWNDGPARGGGWTSERKGPIFELVNRRYKRVLVVETDSVDDGPETILATPGLPTIGSTYALGNDLDSIAQCIDLQCEPDPNSPFVWKVTAVYDSSRTVDIGLSNPLNLPPEINWSFQKYEFPMQRDALNVPLANSSGERFDPPLTAEISRPVVTITRNEVSYNEVNAIAYQDAVNSDVFGPAQPYQAKISSITAQNQIDIGISYWRVTYEIEFQKQTFALFVLDQGFRNAAGQLFRDPIDGSPLANPTLLSGRGYRQVDCYCQLSAFCGVNDTTIQVQNPTGYTGGLQPWGYFPPGPKAGTAHWYFEVLVDSEIMQVIGGFGTNTWRVTRGFAGTTPASHTAAAPDAYVFLQPYFLRFVPFIVLPFAPLNLPI